MTDSQQLLDYRQAILATVPLFAACLYALPSDVAAARRAFWDARVPDPTPNPLPDVRAIWLRRPDVFKGQDTLVRHGWRNNRDCLIVKGDAEEVFFNMKNGRHLERTRGRHTHHGRLNAEACVAALARRSTLAQQQNDMFRIWIRETLQLRLEQAVRLGTGWILATHTSSPHTPTYLIRDPERNAWSLASPMVQFVQDDAILEVVEQGPPARAPVPTMTREAVQAVAESLGCTIQTRSFQDGLFTMISVVWQNITLFPSIAEVGGALVTSCGDGLPATPKNLREMIRASIRKELQRRADAIARAQQELDALFSLGVP